MREILENMRGQVESMGEELGRPVAVRAAAEGKCGYSKYLGMFSRDKIEKYMKKASEQMASMAGTIESQMNRTKE